MSRRWVARRRLTLVATAATVTATGVVVAVALLRESAGPLPRVTRVEVHPVLPGGEHRFGDLVEGRLEVLVPLGVVDSSTVSATLDTAPYRLVGGVRIDRRRVGATGRVRYGFAVDCLEPAACVPRQSRAGFTFGYSRVRYRTRAGVTHSLTVRWPVLHVLPRPQRDIFTPWEDGIRPLATPGYRASPHAVAALFALLSLLVLGGGAVLLRPLVRPAATWRRQPTALEWALAAVRAAAGRRDFGERRRALDLLSRAVRTGVGRSGAEARRLAWSQAIPESQAMTELADRVEQG